MINRRAWIRRAVWIGAAGIGGEQLWRHGNDYVFPVRFVTVVPGLVFRGAWQKPWPMRRIVRDYKIKTVVALAHPPNHYLTIQERKLASELGLKWIHIPIVDNRGTFDRAAEDAVSDLIDQAAAAVADRNNQPVYFHCHHGPDYRHMVSFYENRVLPFRKQQHSQVSPEAAAKLTAQVEAANSTPSTR
jgi:hypothetical protein